MTLKYVRKIKGAAYKNSAENRTCKRSLKGCVYIEINQLWKRIIHWSLPPPDDMDFPKTSKWRRFLPFYFY